MGYSATIPLLDIRNLSVSFATHHGAFKAVDGIDLSVNPDECVAIVGESGSGKSVAMLALMGLLPWTATITADKMMFDGHDLLTIAPKARRHLLGADLAMIFQEPISSLNPCFTVGFQIEEVLQTHFAMSKRERTARAMELLEAVGIAEPHARIKAYPHQLSGGMCQRVMIAMALAGRPKLLIADEPTTALDVTVQAQILDLLLRLRREQAMSLVLITHDMGVVAEVADRVCVQYCGRQVETNTTADLFAKPHHPYTSALLASLPERATAKFLPSIPGVVPGQHNRPQGCLFAPRCAHADTLCETTPPPYADASLGRALCHYPLLSGAARMPTKQKEEAL